VALKTNDDRWKVALWGKNITDEAYQVYLNDLPAFGWLLNGYAAPATYGVSVEYNF
jgi:iron complex outermembrane receptor protein